MNPISQILETYCMVLVHPFRIHQQFRYSVPMYDHESVLYPPLTLAESLGVSWIFAILRGICKIIILNYFLQFFLALQSDSFPLLQDLMTSSGYSTYYFLLFSAAVDIIFFPVVTLIVTQFWSWVIRLYARMLNPDLPAEEIAEQITTHALSSNIFNLIPYIGDLFQTIAYFFLLYAGLRSNLGTSRSLAWVILITPSLLMMMLISFLILGIFCLV
jgi:hypothetical protein